MSSPNKKELKLLQRYSLGATSILETGSGQSTKFLWESVKTNNAKFISIDINSQSQFIKGVSYLTGWSITYEDLIKYTDDSLQSKYDTLDGKIALDKKPELMTGKQGLLKTALASLGYVDFFFCDTGEYCGFAEWNIVQSYIKNGGYIACHDIYYPKSIKCFRILKEIEYSNNWSILVKTTSKQGLLIAQRLNYQDK